MKTPDGLIRLCDNCPERGMEGTSSLSPVTGDLVDKESRYINARFEFVSDPSETPDVPVQNYGSTFIDTNGNQTGAFFAGVELDDIADCEGPVVAGRSGFLKRNRHYDCGAQALKLAEFRSRLKE
jgi:hypothetical protein